jgi:hypothetical protein
MYDFEPKQKESHQPEFAASKGHDRQPPAAHHDANPILQLQRTVGNQAVLRMLSAHSDGGSPLGADVRARYEPGLDTNLSDVRVHTGADSAASAADLHAEAYTVGRDVFFGAGHYQPGSFAGDRLLAHELVHTVQQKHTGAHALQRSAISQHSDPAELEADRAADSLLAGRSANLQPGSQPLAIQRQESGQSKPDAVLRDSVNQWLEQHQFAPPVEQPYKAEQHILLNGEDMTLSQAVKLAADDLKAPAATVQPLIEAALAVRRPVSAKGASYVGGATNTVPGLPLKPETHEDEVKLGKAHELDTIDGWLTEHKFDAPPVRDPAATRAMLDGAETTIDHVADRALAILPQYHYLDKQEVLVHLRQQYVSARGGPVNQILFGYTVVPSFAQFIRPAQANLSTQHQLSFTLTRAHHPNDSPGFETSGQISGTVTFNDAGEVVHLANLQGGVQEAYVIPLLNGWAQLSGLAQVMASSNWSRSAAGVMKAEPGVQVAIGAQALITPPWKFGDAKVQIGAQVLGFGQVVGSPDEGKGAQVQGGVNAGGVVNVQF